MLVVGQLQKTFFTNNIGHEYIQRMGSGLKYANEYLDACRSAVADDEIFARFKSLEGYKHILEHVTPRQGGEYLLEALEMSEEGLLENIVSLRRMILSVLPIHFLTEKRVKSLPLQFDISKTSLRCLSLERPLSVV